MTTVDLDTGLTNQQCDNCWSRHRTN